MLTRKDYLAALPRCRLGLISDETCFRAIGKGMEIVGTDFYGDERDFESEPQAEFPPEDQRPCEPSDQLEEAIMLLRGIYGLEALRESDPVSAGRRSADLRGMIDKFLRRYDSTWDA